MATTRKKSRSHGVSRAKPRPQSSKRKSRLSGQLARDKQDEWDALTDDLETEMGRRHDADQLIPYERADSYLKREVYKFVCFFLEKRKEGILQDILQEARYCRWPTSPTFRNNPFHWAFLALREPADDKLKPRHAHHVTRPMVSRYGRQLLYAWRHRVPPEYLIGFLYQSGSPDVVYEKAGRADAFEPWYTRPPIESA
jgi:hypothetical protein